MTKLLATLEAFGCTLIIRVFMGKERETRVDEAVYQFVIYERDREIVIAYSRRSGDFEEVAARLLLRFHRAAEHWGMLPK